MSVCQRRAVPNDGLTNKLSVPLVSSYTVPEACDMTAQTGGSIGPYSVSYTNQHNPTITEGITHTHHTMGKCLSHG